MQIPTTGNESKQHQRAKERLYQIITEKGIIAQFEIGTGTTETALGKRHYTVDLFGFWYNARTGTFKKIAFEVRGFKGHNSRQNIVRDKRRDQAHLEFKNIYTVRLEMTDLVGRKKQDDETIWNEILYQLK